MKEAIITILGIVLVLIIGAGVYFAFFNGANDMGKDAVTQQGKLQQMTTDSDTVAGNMVKDYADRAISTVQDSSGSDAGLAFFENVFDDGNTPDLSQNPFEQLAIGVRIMESGGQVTVPMGDIESQVKDSGVYEVRKYYDSNGELYVILFDQTDLSN